MSFPKRPYRLVWSKRKLWPLAAAQVLTALIFYVPIGALFLTDRGLSFLEIFWLESILVASITIAELPAGVIGDRTDKRWVLTLGYFLNACAQIIYVFGFNFASFAVSFSLSGIGIALLSGVWEAYVYDALEEEADLIATGVFGHLGALGITGGVIASILGGWMASLNLIFPVIATAIAALLGVCTVLFLPASLNKAIRSDSVAPKGSIRIALRSLRDSPVLLYIAIASCGGYVLFNAVYTINQPLFIEAGLPVLFWGLIVALALLLAAVCSHYADMLEQRFSQRGIVLGATLLGGIGFVLMASVPAPLVLLGFFLVITGWKAKAPVTVAIVNRLVQKSHRATTLSMMSVVGSCLGIMLNPAIGAIVDQSPRIAALAIGVVVVFTALAWIPISRQI